MGLAEGKQTAMAFCPCFLRFMEEVVSKLENDVGIGEGEAASIRAKAIEKMETQERGLFSSTSPLSLLGFNPLSKIPFYVSILFLSSSPDLLSEPSGGTPPV